MKFLLFTCIAVLLAAPACGPPKEPAAVETVAYEPVADEPAADEPAADKPAADKPAAEEPAVKDTGAVVPFVTGATDSGIPDIDAHLGERLPYVRRLDDRVQVDFEGLDIDSDPLMRIDRQPVSRAEFRRRAVMFAGSNEIDRAVTRLLTDQQIALSVAMGIAPEVFEASPEFIDIKLEELEQMLTMQSRSGGEVLEGEPDPAEQIIKEWKESVEASIGWEEYRRLLAADAQFELAFLPMPDGKVEGEPHDMATGPPPLDEDRPDWLPQASWDALGFDEQGRNLRSFVKSWAIQGHEIPAMFKPSILGKVREGLLRSRGVRFFFDADLPDNVLLEVGEEQVRVEEIWPLISGMLADTDIELIVREMLTLKGMRIGLEAAGKWIDQDEFDEIWYQHEQEYAGTLFPLKSIIMFRGYLSLDRYREHYRYREAFNLWRRESLTEDEVLEHYQRGGRLFFERGSVVVDIAYESLGSRPFGETAFGEADELLDAAFASAQDEWQEAREAEDSAAVPHWFTAVAAAHKPQKSKQQGDSHTFQRSQLRMRLAESELSILLTGYSLADDVFYRGNAGEIFGPWGQRCRRHAWGAEVNAGSWAVRVNRFSRRGPVGPFSERNRDMAYEDYLDLNYLWWTQESLSALLPSVKVIH